MQHKNDHQTFITETPEDTGALARKLSQNLKPNDILFLKGDLGAGKSIFARFLIQALCGNDTEVPSPTFTLVQTYKASAFTIWHFDLYRLQHPEEVFELGIEEAYAGGVSLIEWPERLGPYLPKSYLEIEFTHGAGENDRIITITKR